MSDSVWPHRQQPTRLLCPWDSPGKNTGVGCHFLLQCMKVKSEREVAQSCLTLIDPMDCSLPGSSVHGIFQARVLKWGAIVFSILTLQIPFLCSIFRPSSPPTSFCQGSVSINYFLTPTCLTLPSPPTPEKNIALAFLQSFSCAFALGMIMKWLMCVWCVCVCACMCGYYIMNS